LHFPPCSDQTRRRATGVYHRWAVDIARELEHYTSCAEAAGRVVDAEGRNAAAGGAGDAAAVVVGVAAGAGYAREGEVMVVGVEVVCCHSGTVRETDCPASTHTWECTWLKIAMIRRCQAWLVRRTAQRGPAIPVETAEAKQARLCAEQARSRG
jgi:hypothetical protein